VESVPVGVIFRKDLEIHDPAKHLELVGGVVGAKMVVAFLQSDGSQTTRFVDEHVEVVLGLSEAFRKGVEKECFFHCVKGSVDALDSMVAQVIL
jgi:hypothetical protein